MQAATAQDKYAALREEAQRTLADTSETAALEMQRLVDENTLLGHRIQEVEGDLQVKQNCTCTLAVQLGPTCM